jgi:hypothetical protein
LATLLALRKYDCTIFGNFQNELYRGHARATPSQVDDQDGLQQQEDGMQQQYQE